MSESHTHIHKGCKRDGCVICTEGFSTRVRVFGGGHTKEIVSRTAEDAREQYERSVVRVAIAHNGKQTYFEARSLCNAMTLAMGQELTQEQREAYAALARAFAEAILDGGT